MQPMSPDNGVLDKTTARAECDWSISSREQTSHPARRTAAASPPPTGASALAAQASRDSRYDIAERIARESVTPHSQAYSQDKLEKEEKKDKDTGDRKAMEQQIPRRYKPGDVYAPHDLSGNEMAKWKKLRRKPRVGSHGTDVLDSLGVDPRKHYKNFSMMAEYVTEMGRIKHRTETGLRPVNQRRMAKAIRRAIGTGLMPSVYRHPELLRDEMAMRGQLPGQQRPR
ncbi:hypothetical protein LTR56_024583 [Elasticomyces elasticus]|nr:hypothetical protein LTR56_024583 [Elasticomyces elasticus]KAK3622597.1 hypothetical protein LTR22_024746 [Elasticomyces elasticus]KAK4905425.1 hypothetical protein LTR49_025290 [Elasticomyces elasticus]KAK5737513.1 hypothetical protein LTS12_025861 [Elasticomyces elasticus]